jgi:alkylhydroperoxidase family enzyme
MSSATADVAGVLASAPTPVQESIERHLKLLGDNDGLLGRAVGEPIGLAAFLDWVTALQSVVPFRMFQAVALPVATQLRCDHEQARYEHLARKQGMSEADIEALEHGKVTRAATLSDEETAAMALARCIVDGAGHGCEAAYLRIARLSGESIATGCLMVAVMVSSAATMANVWQLDPPAVELPAGAQA